MKAYEPKKLPFNYELSKETLKLLSECEQIYGEYIGYLKNTPYDYKKLLETLFQSELYYSFKIDGSKISKDNMFHMNYFIKNNEIEQFNNINKALSFSINDISNNKITMDTFNKINKIIFLNCSKDNLTKGSGKLRKTQNYILKPGLAGSKVSFIPPVYTELNPFMKNLIEYLNSENDLPFIKTIIAHYQFEKLHPYVSANGKMGRLLITVLLSYYKKEPPILFLSETLDELKNTYFTLLSDESNDDINNFIKFMLQCIIKQCSNNIKKIKKLNKVYNQDIEEFKEKIGGTTIYKVYPIIMKKIVFTTNDIVNECNLHINSVNKVLNKLVQEGYLIKEKRNGTNRVTYCYKNAISVFIN